MAKTYPVVSENEASHNILADPGGSYTGSPEKEYGIYILPGTSQIMPIFGTSLDTYTSEATTGVSGDNKYIATWESFRDLNASNGRVAIAGNTATDEYVRRYANSAAPTISGAQYGGGGNFSPSGDGIASFNSIAYSPDDDYYLTLYKESANNNLHALPMTITGTAISYHNSDTILLGDNPVGNFGLTYDANSGNFIAVYDDDGATKAVVIDVDTSTWTANFNTPITLNAGSSTYQSFCGAIAQIDTGTFLAPYNTSDQDYEVNFKVLVVSGVSVTAGAETTFSPYYPTGSSTNVFLRPDNIYSQLAWNESGGIGLLGIMMGTAQSESVYLPISYDGDDLSFGALLRGASVNDGGSGGCAYDASQDVFITWASYQEGGSTNIGDMQMFTLEKIDGSIEIVTAEQKDIDFSLRRFRP